MPHTIHSANRRGIASITAAVLATGASAYGQVFETVSSGFATSVGPKADAGLVIWKVPEGAQGADLNGDGVANDSVLFVYDDATRTITNTGLATGISARDMDIGHGRIGLSVNEGDQGDTDLNGDGDSSDQVLFVHDTQTGTARNLGYAGWFWPGALADPDWIPFAVYEVSQAFSDLNGDGDRSDLVLFVHHWPTDTTENLGLAIGLNNPPAVGSGHLAIPAYELGQGDFNGDGDTFDYILQVRDLAAGVTVNASVSSWSVHVAGSHVAFLARESEADMDLTGDGFEFDYALHFYDLTDGSVTNTGLGTKYFDDLDFDGRYASLMVNERAVGSLDLNGDGDASALDDVLHSHDVVAGQTVNHAVACDRGALRRNGTRIAVGVPEYHQSADLNSDGDQLDLVLSIAELVPGTTQMTTMTVDRSLALGFDSVASTLAEGSANVDLNGDGDEIDKVLFVHDIASAVTTNLGIQVGDFHLAGHTLVYRQVPLARDRGITPGSKSGLPFGALDLPSQTGEVTPTLVGRRLRAHYSLGGDIAGSVVRERRAHADFNGDGDEIDKVLFITRRL